MPDIHEHPKTAFYHALEDSGVSVKSEVKSSAVACDKYYVKVRRVRPAQLDAIAEAGFTDIVVIPIDGDVIEICAAVPEDDGDA